MSVTRRAFAAGSAFFVVAACQNGVPATPTARTWRAGPPAPYAVQEIYPALHRGAIWIAGGFSPQARGALGRDL